MKKQLVLIGLFILGITALSQAQRNLLYSEDNSGWDEIELTLRKGVILKGKLIGLEVGQSYRIVAEFGDTITIPLKEIKSVSYPDRVSGGMAALPKVKAPKPYMFREQGYYHAATAGIVFATVSEDGSNGVGSELTAVFGYQKSRMLGFGLGSGVDFYQPGTNEVIMPIFAEVRGYFLPQKVTPYYTVRGGYGIAFKNRDVGIWNAQGGWMFNPAVGYRLGGSKGMNMTLDLGLKFQKAFFERREGSTTSDIELIYRRMNVRIGFLF